MNEIFQAARDGDLARVATLIKTILVVSSSKTTKQNGRLCAKPMGTGVPRHGVPEAAFSVSVTLPNLQNKFRLMTSEGGDVTL